MELAEAVTIDASGLTIDTPARLGGDMDLNGQVDFDDIYGFVLGLSNPDGYEEGYGVPSSFNGDTDQEGDHDFDDIDDFVAILTSSLASEVLATASFQPTVSPFVTDAPNVADTDVSKGRDSIGTRRMDEWVSTPRDHRRRRRSVEVASGPLRAVRWSPR